MLSFPFLISLCSRDPQFKNTLFLLPRRPWSPTMVTALWVPFPFLTPLAIRSFFPVEPSKSSVSTTERSGKQLRPLCFLWVPSLTSSSHLAYWPASLLHSAFLVPSALFSKRRHTLWLPTVLRGFPLDQKHPLNQVFFHFSLLTHRI